MSRKKKVATQKEVLEFFTGIMRREADDGNVKISEAMSAADKLYRHFRETEAHEEENTGTGIVILPQINIKASHEGKEQ